MQKTGILLHISSLPSKYGIGTLGREAYNFVDFLAERGETYWQMLPLSPTSYGDSPYQSPSAFAGNPYFIDLDLLIKSGLLSKDDVSSCNIPIDAVDYELLWNTRYPVLRKAFLRFVPSIEYKDWCNAQAWLTDYSLYMAVKADNGYAEWQRWPTSVRRGKAIKDVSPYAEEMEFWKWLQYEFYKQFFALKEYANGNDVMLIGDLPIYVAMDSAEVWRKPELFLFDENLQPSFVAGVPPDAFSEDGQLWGNPLYDWEYHEKTGYEWWHGRLAHALTCFDKVRIDHFRGFESYYKIPAQSDSAKTGEWIKGPELAVFNGVDGLKNRIIAEDLGVITPAVRTMLRKSGFPGMKVLQFAFSTDICNEYLPVNYLSSNCVVYTGTHDNDTTNSWYKDLLPTELGLFKLVTGIKDETPAEALIKLAKESDADTVIVPMQDYMNLDGSARMNYPSKTGWWTWRLPSDYRTKL